MKKRMLSVYFWVILVLVILDIAAYIISFLSLLLLAGLFYPGFMRIMANFLLKYCDSVDRGENEEENNE